MRRLIVVVLIAAGVLLPVLITPAIARLTARSKRGPYDIMITAAGDTAYPRGWAERVVKQNGTTFFEHIKKFTHQAELNFINLETPFTNAEFKLKKEFLIATPPERLDWILSGGFNLLSLANNHAGDAGDQGIIDTIDLLEKKRRASWIAWAGIGKTTKASGEPVIFTVPGKKLKVAFMAYGWHPNKLVNRFNPNKIKADIAAVKSKVNLIIISCHYGKEYTHVPNKAQIGHYRDFIKSGAHIIFGHHPHSIQGVERYKHGVIFYSLGNFSFASYTRRHHKTGAKLYGMFPLIEIKDRVVEKVEILPLYVNNAESLTVDGQTLEPSPMTPRPVAGVFARQIIGDLDQWTRKIKGTHSGLRFDAKNNRGILIQVKK